MQHGIDAGKAVARNAAGEDQTEAKIDLLLKSGEESRQVWCPPATPHTLPPRKALKALHALSWVSYSAFVLLQKPQACCEIC